MGNARVSKRKSKWFWLAVAGRFAGLAFALHPAETVSAREAALTAAKSTIAAKSKGPKPGDVNLLINADFEAIGGVSPSATFPGTTFPGAATSDAAPQGWAKFWAREENSGAMMLDQGVRHSGKYALKATHRGASDWSAAQERTIAVVPGDIVTLRAWLRSEAVEDAEIGVVARRADNTTIDWMTGRAQTRGTHDWRLLSRRFVVPAGCATLQFRLTGNGPGTVWIDDAAVSKTGNINEYAKTAAKLPLLVNRFLEVRLDASPHGGAFSVVDRRTGRGWRQKNFSSDLVLLKALPITAQTRALPQSSTGTTTGTFSKSASFAAQGIVLELWDIANDQNLRVILKLGRDKLGRDKPELEISIEGKAAHPIEQTVDYPQPFVGSKTGTSLVVPLNEGILYPADDASVPAMQLVAYGGHGISMPWFGLAEDESGQGVMTILQTPDDARIDITRPNIENGQTSNLLIRPQWEASRGQWSYTRRLTCVFFASGGYVAQAKRYRDYAQQMGLVKTLAQKKRENPNVDKLLGAANVWNWDMDKVALCREMKSLGMERVLWSSGGNTAQITEINALGFLSSRYDIFQDAWSPDSPSYLKHEGWPQDLVLLPDGTPMRGWDDIQTKPDGTTITHPGGVICSSRQLAHAQKTVPAELRSIPYQCRFIDTTTASPWRECYNPAHPLTRTQDRHNKMELLGYFSRDLKQVTGTETGIDPSVPFVDYYEGMMSLGPYRLPDSGRNMQRLEEATPDLLKFQLGQKYRIPLWELVYHDCVVSHWYWGDYNNKVPTVWARRDAFNVLYGTPPMFMFDRATWERDKSHFTQSYRDICPLVRKLSLDQMLSHEFLTPDHALQRTRWKSGTEIIVNLGDTLQTLPDKREVAPFKWLIK